MSNTATAAKAVATVMLAFRSSFPNGDENFAKLAARGLEDYDEETLRELACPKRGIITKTKFMPTIMEMQEWCNAYPEMRQNRINQENWARAKAEIAEQKRLGTYASGSESIQQPAPQPEMTESEKRAMRERVAALFDELSRSLGGKGGTFPDAPA